MQRGRGDDVSAQGLLDDVFGILHTYDLPDFSGYSARLPGFVVDWLKVSRR